MARLEALVAASADDRKPIFVEAMKEAYPYLWDGRIDLKRATSNEFQTVMREATGAQGTTIDKACSFFFGLAAAAGVELSPHLTPRKSGGTGAPKRAKPRARKPKATVEQPEVKNAPGGKDPVGLAAQLMSKFPDLDPSWPDPLKEKWFAAFEKLMKSAEKTGKL